MQGFDLNNPKERKKLIAAIVLAVIAIGVFWYAFFGSSGGPTTSKPLPSPSPSRSPEAPPTDGTITEGPQPDDRALRSPLPDQIIVAGAPEPKRNIFAFYEPTPKPTPTVPVPTPTPVPSPPLVLSRLTPASVYAGTGDFNLEASGDKFTPATRITMDGREMPTRFLSAQQLGTTVPAPMIADSGTRQVVARTSDGTLYSNPLTLEVMQPPLPNFNYIGIYGKITHNDTAVLQDKNSKEVLNVVLGDVVGQRFRVASISEHEIVLVDTTLKIKHVLPFTREGSTPSR
jgi:hypothetical protein